MATATFWENGSINLHWDVKGSSEKDSLRRASVDSISDHKPNDTMSEDPTSKIFSSLSEDERNNLGRLAFEDLLSECVQELAFEIHREETRKKAVCQVCHTRCLAYASPGPGSDIYGLPLGDKNAVTDKFKCYKCNNWYPAQRYAPHLEKCLGFGGRTNSRSSSRRPGTERASASPFGADSDTESGTVNGEKRGVKRKESPLRKSLGKRMKLSATDFPGRISVPTREPVNSSPLRSSSPIRETSPDVSPSLIGMFANKTMPTIPLVEDFIDIDGDADALGSEEDDLSHD